MMLRKMAEVGSFFEMDIRFESEDEADRVTSWLKSHESFGETDHITSNPGVLHFESRDVSSEVVSNGLVSHCDIDPRLDPFLAKLEKDFPKLDYEATLSTGYMGEKYYGDCKPEFRTWWTSYESKFAKKRKKREQEEAEAKSRERWVQIQEQRDRLIKQLGLKGNIGKNFEKLAKSSFGDGTSVMEVVLQEDSNRNIQNVKVGDTVKLVGGIAETKTRPYHAWIDVKSADGGTIGRLIADEERLLIAVICMNRCIAFIKQCDPMEVYLDLVPDSASESTGDLKRRIECLVNGSTQESSMRFKSMKSYLRKFPERNSVFAQEKTQADKRESERKQSSRTNTSSKPKKPSTPFSGYKMVVRKTIDSDGLSVPVEYKPTRAITQLEKYIEEGKRVAPSEKLQEDDWADLQKGEIVVLLDAPQYGVSRDLLASRAESAEHLTNMLRILALLTDDEMLKRVAEAAPRRKDGKLAANRLAVSIDMDGIFDDGTYYNVSAKSDSSGAIEIAIKRKKQPWQLPFYGGAAKFLCENEDIVQRMGI